MELITEYKYLDYYIYKKTLDSEGPGQEGELGGKTPQKRGVFPPNSPTTSLKMKLFTLIFII